jgi:hypothetical protein
MGRVFHRYRGESRQVALASNHSLTMLNRAAGSAGRYSARKALGHDPEPLWTYDLPFSILVRGSLRLPSVSMSGLKSRIGYYGLVPEQIRVRARPQGGSGLALGSE